MGVEVVWVGGLGDGGDVSRGGVGFNDDDDVVPLSQAEEMPVFVLRVRDANGVPSGSTDGTHPSGGSVGIGVVVACGRGGEASGEEGIRRLWGARVGRPRATKQRGEAEKMGRGGRVEMCKQSAMENGVGEAKIHESLT